MGRVCVAAVMAQAPAPMQLQHGGVVHNPGAGAEGGYAMQVDDAPVVTPMAPPMAVPYVDYMHHELVALHGQWRDGLCECCGVDGASSLCMAPGSRAAPRVCLPRSAAASVGPGRVCVAAGQRRSCSGFDSCWCSQLFTSSAASTIRSSRAWRKSSIKKTYVSRPTTRTDAFTSRFRTKRRSFICGPSSSILVHG